MRLLFFIPALLCVIHTHALDQEKILEINITPAGAIMSGNETIAADRLARYIKDRLFKSWLANGKIYTKIKLTGIEQANDITKEIVLREIKDGQREALLTMCLESYRTTFENLDPKKQEKMKRKYPVLFQTDYS
jgi:hypothetical protein